MSLSTIKARVFKTIRTAWYRGRLHELYRGKLTWHEHDAYGRAKHRSKLVGPDRPILEDSLADAEIELQACYDANQMP